MIERTSLRVVGLHICGGNAEVRTPKPAVRLQVKYGRQKLIRKVVYSGLERYGGALIRSGDYWVFGSLLVEVEGMDEDLR